MEQCGDTDGRMMDPTAHLLSPGGKSRYGRTRRPKIERDFYNIDDFIIDEGPPPRHEPVKSPNPKTAVATPEASEPIFEIKDEFTKIDDLGMKVANNFKINLQRGLDDTIKERKFFKSLPESKMDVSSAVDVTKVFKLISAKTTVVPVIPEARTSSKSALKTYSNKRKHLHDGDSFICESFGLPDEPIVPVSSPFIFERDTKIDVDASCEDNVNITVPWTFDEFEPLPLYASEPVMTDSDITFTRGGAPDLFSCDNTDIDRVLDVKEKFKKSRIPTPVIPTIKQCAKSDRDIRISGEIGGSVKHIHAKKREPATFSNPVKNRGKILKCTNTFKTQSSPLAKLKHTSEEILDEALDSIKEVAEMRKTTKEVNKSKVSHVSKKLNEIIATNEDTEWVKNVIYKKRALRSSSEPERAKNTNVLERFSRSLDESEIENNSDEDKKITTKIYTFGEKKKKKKRNNITEEKRSLRSSIGSNETSKIFEILDDNIKILDVKRVLRKSTESPDRNPKRSPRDTTGSGKSTERQAINTGKRVLRSSVCLDETERKSDGDFESSGAISCPLIFRKRRLRGSTEAEVKDNISERTFGDLLPTIYDASDDVLKTVKDGLIQDETLSSDKTHAIESLDSRKKRRIAKAANQKISPVKKKLQTLRDIAKFSDNNNIDNLFHSSFLSPEHSSTAINHDPLTSDGNNTKVTTGKSQVVNPVNISKMMAGPQVRVLLNPLSVFDHASAFKIQHGSPLKGRESLDSLDEITDDDVHPKNDEEVGDGDVKNIKTETFEFDVGDLTWAKIGSHPYWPCIITPEPESGYHKKTLVNRLHPAYHVRFFGDKGRRSWVTAQNIMLYCGRDDLDRIADVLKAENQLKASYIKECYTVRGRKLVKWQIGVNEAESLKNKSVEERLNYFDEIMLDGRREGQRKVNKEKIAGSSVKKRRPTSETECIGRKTKEETVEIKKEKDEVKEETETEVFFDEEGIKKETLKRKSVKLSPDVSKLTEERPTLTEQTETFKSPNLLNKSGSPDGQRKTCKKNVFNGDTVVTTSPQPKKKVTKVSRMDEETTTAMPLSYKKNNRKAQSEIALDSRLKISKKASVSDDISDDDMPLSKSLKQSFRKERENWEENSESRKRMSKQTQSDTSEDAQTSESRKKFLRKEESSEEARKKLRYFTVKNDSGEAESGQKSKRNSTEENSHQENEETEDEGPKPRNRRHQIGGEYSNSDTDSKFSDNSSVPASLESQAALYRRNNIFRGVPKEKMCQICEQSGEVFKCKGPCSGVYHYECAAVHEKEKRFEDEEVEKFQEEEKSNVEIISVNSKKPLPTLSDSPNFHGMTLAEKIDFRMKEIMKKFDYQSMYAESTDSSSEECVMDDSFDKLRNQSKLSLTVTNKPSNKEVPIIKHVTADNVSYICVTDERPKDTREMAALIRDTMKCSWCLNDETPNCLVCNKDESKSGSKFRQKCSLHQCGKFYHPDCLKSWPQTQWSLIQSTKDKKYDTFVCPRHVCHTCISDDPRASNSRCSSDKVVKCLRCPATYHSSNYCVPAGTHISSTSQIVCPRHYIREKSAKKRMQQTINTNWCFICSKGGDLICCETCPTSVHAECLPGDFNEDDTFYCEDCQSGRLPLYDEIVWVKLGSFRWWPALILFPNEVPDNVRNIAHNKGEFVVKFFGTYDHYWVGRGRTFLFQEGDKGHSHSVKKRVDSAFLKAIEEAAAAHQLKKQFKLNKAAEKSNALKPPPYIKIKINKPVGSVRLGDGNTSNTTSCECDPNQPHPCGPDSDCLNRLLLTECNPEVCSAGDRCNNQCFERREYPPLVPHKTHARGWGLKTLAPIRKGQFVIEYVGEVIDEQEYQRRIQKMHEQKEENYYFLTIDKDRTLDAGPKGNVARFMNHSCQPNCETQKWTVNGDTRVGLFAKCDIPADTELTFNYNLECIGKEKKICKCGAPNCSGFIGVKVKSEAPRRKASRPKRKKTPPRLPKVIDVDEPCFVCGKTGDVTGCNNKICTKYYHLGCVGLKSWPEGGKWVCQWHNCNICSKRTIRCCVKCVNSYCPSHSNGFVRYDKLLGFVCFEHDPEKMSTSEHVSETPPAVGGVGACTEEDAVTSTTSEEAVVDGREARDVVVDPLSEPTRLNGAVTSTPSKKPKEESRQDESTVSSAGTSYTARRNKKRTRTKKKIVTKKEDPQVTNTANLFNSTQNEVKLSNFTPVKYLRTSRNSAKVLNRTDPEKDLPIRKRTRLRCSNSL